MDKVDTTAKQLENEMAGEQESRVTGEMERIQIESKRPGFCWKRFLASQAQSNHAKTCNDLYVANLSIPFNGTHPRPNIFATT